VPVEDADVELRLAAGVSPPGMPAAFLGTPYWQIHVDEPRSPQPQVPFRQTTWRLSCRTCARKRPRTKSSARPQFTLQNADNAVLATPSMRWRPGGVLRKSGVAARQMHNVMTRVLRRLSSLKSTT
jgi:hypothetical protein